MVHGPAASGDLCRHGIIIFLILFLDLLVDDVGSLRLGLRLASLLFILLYQVLDLGVRRDLLGQQPIGVADAQIDVLE